MKDKDKPRMGRPPLSEEEKRSDTIRFRATSEDREILEAAAEAKGLDLSAWMRDVLLRSARKVLSSLKRKKR